MGPPWRSLYRAGPEELFIAPRQRGLSPRLPTGVLHRTAPRMPCVVLEETTGAPLRRTPTSFGPGGALPRAAQVFLEAFPVPLWRSPSLHCTITPACRSPSSRQRGGALHCTALVEAIMGVCMFWEVFCGTVVYFLLCFVYCVVCILCTVSFCMM